MNALPGKVNGKYDKGLSCYKNMMGDVVFLLSSKVPKEETDAISINFTDIDPYSPISLFHWYRATLLQTSAQSGFPCHGAPQKHGLHSVDMWGVCLKH